ncbi:MAG: type III-A CRISPR-associated RAMP protein Csm3, partial [Nitrospirae bacterium]
RNPLNNQPYIPGSSLKGKMRSLLEKKLGLPLRPVAKDIYIHKCTDEDPEICLLCRVFGIPAEVKQKKADTRLIVRDCNLAGYRDNGTFRTGPDAVQALHQNRNMVLPYTEVKTEVVIDRVTSRATPRTFERVPAGVVFDMNLIINIFETDNEKEILDLVFDGLVLLQNDYLGGQGSRGYGQVKFHIQEVTETVFSEAGRTQEVPLQYPVPEQLR